MKTTIILLAALRCGANAAWLRWSLDSGPVWSPQETSIAAAGDDQAGWTPKPTQIPGEKLEGEVVLDLLRRQDSTTTWTNSETCGWFAGISSSAVECGGGFKCETNTDHVVACVSATISDFYSACLDYSAHLAGSCDNVGPKTGCCTQSDVPACGTYLWTSKPERSMYKCFETASVLTILDVPQFVIDASLASKSRAMTQTSDTTDDANPSTPTTDGGSPTAPAPNPGSAQGDPSGGNSNSNTTNIGAIVGGAVGGVAALALIIGCIMFALCRRRKKSKSIKEKTRNVSRELHHHTKELLRDNINNNDDHGGNTNTYIQTHDMEPPPPLTAPGPVKESSTTSSSPNARSSRDARREARRGRRTAGTGAGGSGSGSGSGQQQQPLPPQQQQQQGPGSVSVSYTLNNSSHTATFARAPSERDSTPSSSRVTAAAVTPPPGPETRRPRNRGGRHSSSDDDDYDYDYDDDSGREGAAYDEIYGEYHHDRARGRSGRGGDGDGDGDGEDRGERRGGQQQGGGGFVGGPSWRQSL
ncbi:hypothetical protein F5X99DRAFT_404753 [Biscogniauxia marginata]|nr:hypothetical protein F5X99DRAFT_404753 [Biscogniauxia marginata]